MIRKELPALTEVYNAGVQKEADQQAMKKQPQKETDPAKPKRKPAKGGLDRKSFVTSASAQTYPRPSARISGPSGSSNKSVRRGRCANRCRR